MTEPVVLLNVDTRGVATIVLNRPTVNNAYNGEVIEEMINAVGQCAADDNVRIVVIKGNGKHFQAGADLKWLKEISDKYTKLKIGFKHHSNNYDNYEEKFLNQSIIVFLEKNDLITT